MLADIPKPVEDEANIVVPLSLLRSANCATLDRPLITSAARRTRTTLPSESSETPLPEDLRAAQLPLFVFRRRPIVELRAGNADR